MASSSSGEDSLGVAGGENERRIEWHAELHGRRELVYLFGGRTAKRELLHVAHELLGHEIPDEPRPAVQSDAVVAAPHTRFESMRDSLRGRFERDPLRLRAGSGLL